MRTDPAHLSFDESCGALTIQPHGHVSAPLRLGSWADGLLLHRHDGTRWTPTDADPEILLLGAPSSPCVPRLRFTAEIPAEVRRLVAPFRRHQLTLLRLARWCDGADELIDSAPVLSWLLAGHMAPRFDAARAAALLRGRRVKMLSAIVGASASSAALRLIARYKPTRWSEHSEQILIRVLRDPKLVAWCGHERELDPRLLFALVRHRSLADGRFLRAAIRGRHADDPELLKATRAAHEALDLGHDLGRTDAARIVMSSTTTAQLISRVDRWRARLARMRAARIRELILAKGASVSFRAAPLPGTGAIIPITDPFELLDEADVMDHCATSFLVEVLGGMLYFYRVLAPERATLSVMLLGEAPTIDELRGRRNAKVSEATRSAVQAWLHEERHAWPAARAARRAKENDPFGLANEIRAERTGRRVRLRV